MYYNDLEHKLFSGEAALVRQFHVNVALFTDRRTIRSEPFLVCQECSIALFADPGSHVQITFRGVAYAFSSSATSWSTIELPAFSSSATFCK